jgi:hypothetical protein
VKIVVQQLFIADSWSAPMPTECTSDSFGFAPVEGREVVAAFDGGAISSDAGALLLGATDRAIAMMDGFAKCFHDERRADLIEHEVVTLVGQRVFGIALGYEDLNDHDELRHDPVMAVLAGKLEARRKECAPVAGKSTLNRLELSRLEPTRYHKISHNPVAIKKLLVDLFLEAHAQAPSEIILDLDATDDPVHGEQEGRFFHGYYDLYGAFFVKLYFRHRAPPLVQWSLCAGRVPTLPPPLMPPVLSNVPWSVAALVLCRSLPVELKTILSDSIFWWSTARGELANGERRSSRHVLVCGGSMGSRP